MAKKKSALELLQEREKIAKQAAELYREERDEQQAEKRTKADGKMVRIGPRQHEMARHMAALLNITMRQLLEEMIEQRYQEEKKRLFLK